jgi:hypothetical protein
MHRFGRLLALSAAIALVIGAPAEAQNAKCTRESGPAPAAGTALSSQVTLTPDREAEVINFGAGRGTQERDILITASKPLPKSVTPRQIGLDVPRRFERVGNTLESVSLLAPRFTKPQISPDRREIRFTACVDGNGLKPGTYAGTMRVTGPTGLERAVVAVTVNAKAELWVFILALVGALGIAALLLVYRRIYAKENVDWNFALESAIPLGAAFGAMYAAYAQDASWGADPVTSGLALIATALAAAGLKSIIDGAVGRSG